MYNLVETAMIGEQLPHFETPVVRSKPHNMAMAASQKFVPSVVPKLALKRSAPTDSSPSSSGSVCIYIFCFATTNSCTLLF